MPVSRIIVGAALALAATAPPARAATDSVIATTARATPLAAGSGHVLYSAWDGTGYRLTDAGRGALPVPGSPAPFRADIGLDANDHAVAVYPRCTGGESGCDLFMYDFATAREHALRAANSPAADEVAGAVWRDRLVFSRLYGQKGVLYQRSLAHPSRASTRVATQRAYSVDIRGTRVPFSDVREWSREPWLASASRTGASRLTLVPGSGAAVDFLDAMSPTAYGSSIYWLLVRDGDSNVSIVHRYNRTLRRDEQVEAPIGAVASGFAWDGGDAYYAVPAPEGYAIHRATGLTFVKAPPIKLQ